MLGITKAFETQVDGLDREALEKPLNGAFSDYFTKHRNKLDRVEQSGVTISRNIVSAAEHVSATDGDSEKGFRAQGQFLNPKLALYLNSDTPRPQRSVGVLAPEYHETQNPGLIRRDVND